MNFGENLKLIRKQRKMSQETLAEKVGVSRQSVSKWEVGEAYPEMNNILELCKIFKCHINDLVHEDMSDINSLDEEIIMSVAKLKKEEQKKMKGISKAISTIAKIGEVGCKIALVFFIILAVFLPIMLFNCKTTNNNELNIFGEKINYERNDQKIVLTTNNETETITKKDDVKTINYVFDILESKKSVMIVKCEIIIILLLLTFIFVKLSLKNLYELFKNIHDGETPFTLENVEHIKKLTYFIIASFAVSLIGEGLVTLFFNSEPTFEIGGINIILILSLFCISYIFEYGYEIQKDSKGVMYDEK